MALQAKISELDRLQEIIRVCSIAGFGDIFKQMGFEGAAEGPSHRPRSRVDPHIDVRSCTDPPVGLQERAWPNPCVRTRA